MQMWRGESPVPVQVAAVAAEADAMGGLGRSATGTHLRDASPQQPPQRPAPAVAAMGVRGVRAAAAAGAAAPELADEPTGGRAGGRAEGCTEGLRTMSARAADVAQSLAHGSATERRGSHGGAAGGSGVARRTLRPVSWQASAKRGGPGQPELLGTPSASPAPSTTALVHVVAPSNSCASGPQTVSPRPTRTS